MSAATNHQLDDSQGIEETVPFPRMNTFLGYVTKFGLPTVLLCLVGYWVVERVIDPLILAQTKLSESEVANRTKLADSAATANIINAEANKVSTEVAKEQTAILDRQSKSLESIVPILQRIETSHSEEKQANAETKMILREIRDDQRRGVWNDRTKVN